jgi:outer membrane protein TolC
MDGLPGVRVVTGAAAAILLMAYVGLTPALVDTIEAGLVRAYQNNPQLNAQRTSVRDTDENVPQALSGYRPRVALTASAGSALNAVGRLAPQVLKLATTVYDPSLHYQRVRDSWYGVRTPDGR